MNTDRQDQHDLERMLGEGCVHDQEPPVIYHASTLGQLRHAVASLIDRLGEDAHIGLGYDDTEGPCIDGFLQLDWVVIDAEGNVVGAQADGCRAGEGTRNAVRVG